MMAKAAGSLLEQYNQILQKLARAQAQAYSGIGNVRNMTLPQLLALEQSATGDNKTSVAQLAQDLGASGKQQDASTKALMKDLAAQGVDTSGLAHTAQQATNDQATSNQALDAYSQALTNRLAQQNASDTTFGNALFNGAQTDVNNKVAQSQSNAYQAMQAAAAAGGSGGGGGGGRGFGGGGGSGSNQGLTEAQINSLAQKLVGLKGATNGRIDQKTLDQLVGDNKVDMENPLNAEVIHNVEQRVLSGYGPDTAGPALQSYLQDYLQHHQNGVDVGDPNIATDVNGKQSGTATRHYSADQQALDNFIQAVAQRGANMPNPMTQSDVENNYLNDFGWNFARLEGQDPGPHPDTLSEPSPYEAAWTPSNVAGQDRLIAAMTPEAALDFANRHPYFNTVDSLALQKLAPQDLLGYAKNNPQQAKNNAALKLLVAKAMAQTGAKSPAEPGPRPFEWLPWHTNNNVNTVAFHPNTFVANSHMPVSTPQPQPNGNAAFMQALQAAQQRAQTLATLGTSTRVGPNMVRR